MRANFYISLQGLLDFINPEHSDVSQRKISAHFSKYLLFTLQVSRSQRRVGAEIMIVHDLCVGIIL